MHNLRPYNRSQKSKEQEEERSLIKDLKRYVRLAIKEDQHGSLVPGCT